MDRVKLERLIDEFFPNQSAELKTTFYRRLTYELEKPGIVVKTQDGTNILVEPKNAKQVRSRVNKLRHNFGYTQMRLSELSEVPQSTLSRFDKTERHVDWHWFALASALNCKIEDLFEYHA